MEPDRAPIMIISADGHATARMPEYREYLDPEWREEFDAFCVVHAEKGTKNFEPESLLLRMDPDVVDDWVRDVLEPGRDAGNSDPHARLEQHDRDGVAGEVLIPEFGLPFELYGPLLAAERGWPPRPQPQVAAANRAYNRWLADFSRTAPERFAGMASISFVDVDAAVTEIRRVRDDGLRGVMLPFFSDDAPVFDPRYDVIWATLSDLGLPLNSHIAISGISDVPPTLAPVPHPACFSPIIGAKMLFNCHQLLPQMIWGGVFERHPRLQVAFTEQGSGWVIAALQSYDHSWEGSYLRHDIREVVKRRPSEYFHRQCHLGSSLLSREEVEARHEIGVDRMAFGVDYPHHEGTWHIAGGTRDYLRATFGASRVPLHEARMILGENAARLWSFDVDALQPVVDRIAPSPDEVLTPPSEDRYPRGDVGKPLSAV
jgi:predicted TIM-barrel fold metal-dependent hydrolase